MAMSSRRYLRDDKRMSELILTKRLPILRISRPRFWLYVLGPYLIGVAAAATSPSDLLRPTTILFGLYFLLPANLLVYGINDIYDFETDAINPKKAGYETLVTPEKRRPLLAWIIALNAPFLVIAVFAAPGGLPLLLAFGILSIFYSAPPIRAKEVPFLDSIFNILYVFPGLFGYTMLSGSFAPPVVTITAGFWTAAMHAFSAIPDIEADRAANVETIATKLGKDWTLGFCMACYFAASVLTVAFAPPLMLFGLMYVSLMRWASYSSSKDDGVFSVYRWFPIINSSSGFLIFWYTAWSKFF